MIMKYNKYKKYILSDMANMVLIFVISLFICKLILFKSDALFDNDVDFHYARVMSTVHAWMDHQFVPQLDPTAVKGFGYSWNLFYGPLPTYFIAGLFFICRDLAFSVNLTSVIIVFCIGLMMYRYIKYRTQSQGAALVSAVSMITSTSVLLNIYQYSGYGPLFAMFFAILSLYGIQLIFDKEKNGLGVLLLGFGGSGMLLSHTLSCLVMVIYIMLLLICHFKITLKRMKSFVLSACLSLGLSAYFLLPFIELKNLNIYNLFNKSFVKVYMWKNPNSMNFGRVSFKQMFSLEQLNVASFPIVSFIISLVLLCLICSLLVFKRIKKEESKLLSDVFLFFLFALSIFVLCSNWMDWHKLPGFLWTMQSPIRIMFYASGLLFSVYIGLSYSYVIRKAPRFITIILSIFLVVINVIFSQSLIDSPHNNFAKYFHNLKKIDASYSIEGEQFLKTAIGEFFPTSIGTQEKSLSQIISEKDFAYYFSLGYIYPALDKRIQEGIVNTSDNQPTNFKVHEQKYSRSEFVFDVPKMVKTTDVEIPKIYYPGYKAYSYMNGEKVALRVVPSKRGFVQVNLPKEKAGRIIVYYGLSRATIIGVSLTLLSIFISICYLIKYRRDKKREIRHASLKRRTLRYSTDA